MIMRSKPNHRRTVVVTGASAGVGRAIVREFAKEGAQIGLLARNGERLELAKKEVEQVGGTAIVLPTDVSDPKQVEDAAQMVENHFGAIDVWINNAMVSVFSPVKKMAPDEYKRVTEVTYLGYVYGTLCALKRMLPRDQGIIIQVGSALAYRSIPLQSAYCAAKHAINGFTESLRSELIHDKSRVQVVQAHLPAVNTPQFDWVKSRLSGRAQPVPPIFQPEVIAKAIHWLADHPRREMYLGYPTTKAIIADKIAPGLADHYLARFGYEAQQTAEPADPNQPYNLWESVPGHFGAHGRFDDRAKHFSFQIWANMHRGALIFMGLGTATLAWILRKNVTHRAFAQSLLASQEESIVEKEAA